MLRKSDQFSSNRIGVSFILIKSMNVSNQRYTGFNAEKNFLEAIQLKHLVKLHLVEPRCTASPFLFYLAYEKSKEYCSIF